MPNLEVKGVKLDQGELVIAQTAIRTAVNDFTYAGIKVGSYVSDEQCLTLAIAVATAIENYRNGQTI